MKRLVPLLALASSACSLCGAPAAPERGYWSSSCVTDDGRSLLAGGDHAALIALSSGKIVEQVPKLVKAVGCEDSAGVVVGFTGAYRLPGSTPAPVPPLGGDRVVGLDSHQQWISSGRKSVGGKSKGPASVFVTGKAATRSIELFPGGFGKIGEAKQKATADSFAVRFGNLLEDRRVVVAAGFVPAKTGDTFEDVPWAFFAIDPETGAATALTAPLSSTALLNQAWAAKVAASPDGAHLVFAAHDGQQVTVAQFARDGDKPVASASFPAAGSPSAAAVSADGQFVAAGTESRGSDAPARAWAIDRTGKVIWSGEFPKTVIGLHFLADHSLVVTTAEARAVRIALPAGTVSWKSE